MPAPTAKTVRVARFVVAFGAAALSFGVATAHADAITDAVPVKTVVDYADLDLSQDADVQALYTRLRKASERVCGDNKDLRNLRMKRLYDACYQDSLARAVDNVGHAAVKAVFAADESIKVAVRTSKTMARS